MTRYVLTNQTNIKIQEQGSAKKLYKEVKFVGVVMGDMAGKYKSKKNLKFFISTIAFLYQTVNFKHILHRKFFTKKKFYFIFILYRKFISRKQIINFILNYNNYVNYLIKTALNMSKI